MSFKKLFSKKVLSLALSLSVIGGASAFTYANKSDDVSTKNVPVTVQSEQTAKTYAVVGNISDEKAIQMAAEALKNYMDVDASMYNETNITRQNPYEDYLKSLERRAQNKEMTENNEVQLDDEALKNIDAEKSKKAEAFKNTDADEKQEVKNITEETVKDVLAKQPADEATAQEEARKYEESVKTEDNTITVNFTNAGEGKEYYYSFVEIDEITGEIVNVTSINGLDLSSNFTIDDTKVRNTTLEFFKKIGKDVDENSISIDNNNGSLSVVKCNLKDGSEVSIEVDLINYTCMHYQDYSNTHNKK